MKKMKLAALMTVLLSGLVFTAQAGEDAHTKFNAGDMIMHHITDAHEWHVADIGHTHITVPLPVILYSNSGLDIFMSNKLEGDAHGARTYGNYIYEHGHFTSVDGAKIYDFSITKNTAAMMLSVALMLVIFLAVARGYKKNKGAAPKGIQSLFEPLIVFIRDEVAKQSIGPGYERFMPYLLTVFFFIWMNNLLGLIPFFPGGANVTGNVAVTLVLALFTFVITTFSAKKDYWIHIFNTPGVPWWLKFPVPLMPLVEFLGVLTKPFVLCVRLFANITAGHIIMLAFFSLIFIFGEMSAGIGYGVSIFSVAFTIFMNCLELLVAFLQAYVFTLLSALYFGSAIEEHAHHDHH